MARDTPTPRRRWSLPSPIIFFLIAARLSSSSFRASAQYVSSHTGGTLQTRRIQPLGQRDQKSSSRELTINSFDDFCLFGPPDPFNYIWSSGLNVVSWCAKDGHGTRLIPDGTLHGVTFVKTKDYVQVSGTGDFTKINIAPGDVGGQFDSRTNTPDGATVKSGSQPAGSWVTLISANTFCLRACTGDAKYCPSQYDQMGCWFFTGNAVGAEGTWQNCESDSGDPPGVIDGKTFTQGNQPVPQPSAPDLRNCQKGKAVSNRQAPPPLYDWDGHGDVASPIGSGKPNGNTSGNKNGDKSGGNNNQNNSPSTTWLPVETCVPCQQPLVASGGSSTKTTTTEQVGVTQMSGQVAALAKTTSATKGTTANDQLDRREDPDQTITKDGKCCHTTWTPSIIGGISSTTKNAGTTATGGTKTSGTLSGVTTSGTLQIGGGVVPSGQTGTVRPSGSSASGVTGGNGTGNGTNGTGNGHRLEVVGVSGMRGVLLALVMVMAMGLGGGSLFI